MTPYDIARRNVIEASKRKDVRSATSDELAKFRKVFGNDTGVTLGHDRQGYFVHTHRARSKSYENIADIPKSAIKFIESTG